MLTTLSASPAQSKRSCNFNSLESNSILHYIHRHNFPDAVPPAIQSCVGWKTATAGTAVMVSLPSWASCMPSAL